MDNRSSKDTKNTQISRRSFLKVLGLGTGGLFAATTGITYFEDKNLLSASKLTGMQTGSSTSSGGFNWAQTHVDTSWVTRADSNNNLTVEKVTNLNSSGEGSLKAALSAAEDNENTVIVFEVGGVIDLGGQTYLRSHADNVYIAGQTAPSPGITLIRGGTRIHGENTIVQHLTYLPGNKVDEPHKSRGVTIDQESGNVLFDHCAIGWAPDTNIDIHTNSNVAFINCINAEPLNNSAHPEAPHGYGFYLEEDSTNITYLGNLQTHSWKRNYYPNPGVQSLFANNYIYNWGERIYHGGETSTESDMINNVIEAGPDTTAQNDEGIFDANPGTVYWNNNSLIPQDTVRNDEDIDYVNSPMNLPSGLSENDLLSPSNLENYLIQNAGPRPADRAPFAQRIINQFSNREGGIIDDQSDVGGYPDYQSNQRTLNVPSSGILNWIQTNHTAAVENGNGTTNTGGTGNTGGTNSGNTTQQTSNDFGWDQTFTDTSWLTSAGDNINIEKVTSLDPSELEQAAKASGPTIVVFEVGGTIDMDGSTLSPSSETWIAGETAPDPGISIIQGGVEPESNKVIVSHLGIYAGDGAGGVDSAIEPRADDVIFDHCSAYWGVDEVIGMSPSQDRVSIINTVIAEGLDESKHSEGAHSRGYLINEASSEDLCTMGCLFASNNRRQPWAKSPHVLVNNLIFNHCSSPNESGNIIKLETEMTAVGIYLKPSDETQMGEAVFQNGGELYHKDIEPNGHELSSGEQDMVDSPPLLPSGLSLENDPVPASELENWMRANTGMRPAARPSAEQDFFQNRFNDTFAGTIDSQEEVGGYPNYQQTQRTLNVPSSGILNWIQTNHTAAVENGNGTTNTGGTRNGNTPSDGSNQPKNTNGNTPSDGSNQPKNKIGLEGGDAGDTRQYLFYTNGYVEKNDEHEASSPTDRVFTSKVVGKCAGGHDGYIVHGQITEFYAEDGITITYNGQEMTPSEFKETDVCNI